MSSEGEQNSEIDEESEPNFVPTSKRRRQIKEVVDRTGILDWKG